MLAGSHSRCQLAHYRLHAPQKAQAMSHLNSQHVEEAKMIPLSNRAPSEDKAHWRQNRPWCRGSVTRRPKLSRLYAKNRPSAARSNLSHVRSPQSNHKRAWYRKNKPRKIRKQIEHESLNAKKTLCGSCIKSWGERHRRAMTSNTCLRRLTSKKIRSTNGSGIRRKRSRKIRSLPLKSTCQAKREDRSLGSRSAAQSPVGQLAIASMACSALRKISHVLEWMAKMDVESKWPHNKSRLP